MSKVMYEETRLNGTKHTIVQTDEGKWYLVSTADTFDNGPETMVFKCDKTGTVNNARDLYAEWHKTMDEGYSRNDMIAHDVEAYIATARE